MNKTIADILSENSEATEDRGEALRLEISQHIETMKRGMNQYYEKLNQGTWNRVNTLRFFKSAVRSENVERILQYLLLFLAVKSVSLVEESRLSNPFFQLREFVENEAKLLGEKDVIAAILGEYVRAGLLNDQNLDDTEKKINDKRREISEWVSRADSPTAAGFETLCRALKEMSLFWFDVRQQDIRRASGSDIFIYRSVNLLENRLRRDHSDKKESA